MIPNLLSDITKCTNFCNLITNSNCASSCNDIVDSQRYQGANEKKDFQLPEPWTGDIINAPILILSSNPGYSGDELYPNFTWPAPMVADFFINRFQNRGSKYSWVYENKVLKKDGKRGISVRYWTSIKKRVEELLLSPAIPGIHYCITEIVHCKSLSEKGVKKALPECSNSFLENKIRISGAKIIIGIGDFVRKYFNEESSIDGIPITYLPHPNAFKPKTFYKTHTEENIKRIRKILSNEHNVLSDIDYSDMSLPSEEEVKLFIDSQITTHNRGTVLKS